MKKILILNGSHSEIPLICAAKQLGYFVITSGNNPNLIGHAYADLYEYGDYSDENKMLEIAQKNKIDAVCSCANDFGAISAAFVAEKMHLQGHDSYETCKILHQKDKFKVFSREKGILTPMADNYTNIEDAKRHGKEYKYPMIIKPVDLTGGKGVRKVDNVVEYEQAIEEAFIKSKQGRIVVEKYINGTYHSFSTFLVDKKVIAFYSDNEYSYINPYFVASSCGPASDEELIKDTLIAQAEIFAHELNLVNGVFHMQYVMDQNKMPYIIDITRRCSGDIYTEPVEHALDIPWSKWIVMSECGYSSDKFVKQAVVRNKICGRHCVMARTNGNVKSVKISKELRKNIYKELMWWESGYTISNYLVDKLGIIFYEFDTREEMSDKLSRLEELITIEFE